MKKRVSYFILSFLLVSFLAGVVSAAPSDMSQQIKTATATLYELIRPVLEAIVGEASNTSTFLAKVLFLVIIFSVVYAVLNNVPFFTENGWVLWIITVATSILSVRWFGNAEVVMTAILPYSAFGIAITCGLPFVLYFFVIKDFSKTLRKISWIFFAVIFLGLWFMRSGSGTDMVGGPVGTFSFIYLATALLALAMLGFDGTIHRTLNKIKAEKAMSYKDIERKYRILGELDEARNLKAKARTKAEMNLANDEIKRLERVLTELGPN